MDKSFIIFIAVGLGFLYFIKDFVGEIQQDDRIQTQVYKEEHKYDTYQKKDSIGRAVLDVTGATKEIQLDAWHQSKLKEQFIDLFPKFPDLRDFVEVHVRGEVLKAALMNTIDTVESRYFEGSINDEEAKRALGLLKS